MKWLFWDPSLSPLPPGTQHWKWSATDLINLLDRYFASLNHTRSLYTVSSYSQLGSPGHPAHFTLSCTPSIWVLLCPSMSIPPRGQQVPEADVYTFSKRERYINIFQIRSIYDLFPVYSSSVIWQHVILARRTFCHSLSNFHHLPTRNKE